MTIKTVFVIGAIIHGVAALVFGLVGSLTSVTKVRVYALLAALVALVTASVYVAQHDNVGVIVRSGDGVQQYVAEWIGYSLSLVLIGYALASSVGSNDLFVAGASLGLVGAGGVLGLFVSSTAAQISVFALTTLVYTVFFVSVWRPAERTRLLWFVVAFALITLVFYMLPYAAGPPVANVWSATTEHIFYVIGNVLSKIGVPIVEIVLANDQPSML